MILHDYVLSPSCYKIRLMAALTGLPLELKPVNAYPGLEHRRAAFLSLNPAGTLPVLEDGPLALTETAAMLVYLARHAHPAWLGSGQPADDAQIAQWLAFAQRLTTYLGDARQHDMFGTSGDIGALRFNGIVALRELEAALAERRFFGGTFLVGEGPTIADIACFPFVALAPDGGVSLDPYPSMRLWMRAIRSLPGFIEMPGIHRLHDLKPEPA